MNLLQIHKLHQIFLKNGWDFVPVIIELVIGQTYKEAINEYIIP